MEGRTCSCGLMMYLGGSGEGLFWVCEACDPHHMGAVEFGDDEG